MLRGIDFSHGSGLTTKQIQDAGFSFVCRYLSGGGAKDIDVTELENYATAGIAVVFVWETTGVDMTDRTQGEKDAGAAQYELEQLATAMIRQDLAMAPVYFAADARTEVNEPAYLRGVNSVITKARTGIYGGYHSVKAAFDADLVAYGWQTYAWSAGQWDDRALLRQVLNGIKVGPADCDLDEAAFWSSARVLTAADDFGQWPLQAPAPPAPGKRVVCNGVQTVAGIARRHGTTVHEIIAATVQHVRPGPFSHGQRVLLDHLANERPELGTVLWLP